MPPAEAQQPEQQLPDAGAAGGSDNSSYDGAVWVEKEVGPEEVHKRRYEQAEARGDVIEVAPESEEEAAKRRKREDVLRRAEIAAEKGELLDMSLGQPTELTPGTRGTEGGVEEASEDEQNEGEVWVEKELGPVEVHKRRYEQAEARGDVIEVAPESEEEATKRMEREQVLRRAEVAAEKGELLIVLESTEQVLAADGGETQPLESESSGSMQATMPNLRRALFI